MSYVSKCNFECMGDYLHVCVCPQGTCEEERMVRSTECPTTVLSIIKSA